MSFSVKRLREYSTVANFSDPPTKNGINAVYALLKSAIEENLQGESTDAAVRPDIIDSLVRDNVDDVVSVSVTLYSPARGPP